jgi:hypothetical protein
MIHDTGLRARLSYCQWLCQAYGGRRHAETLYKFKQGGFGHWNPSSCLVLRIHTRASLTWVRSCKFKFAEEDGGREGTV